jgi:hypothetical protein
MRLPELGAEQETGRAEQLQLTLPDGTHAEEPVHVVHGQGEHLLLAPLLLAHLHNSDIVSEHRRAAHLHIDHSVPTGKFWG